jgi:TM2 domain-containing membrane protein YozV
MSTAPESDSFRIGTAEREEATQVLGEHFAEGRLTSDEYEARVSAAFEAENRAQLRPLFDDLPAPRPVCLQPPPAPFPQYPAPTQQYPAPYQPQPFQAPFQQPVVYYPLPESDKSKVIAGVLQLVFPFGVGRFYTGHVGLGLAQLFVVIITLGFGILWPWIDGIILLASGGTDSTGRRLRN